MRQPVVSGGAVVSKVMLVGQAPGDKEPVLGRPFAWTAGKTLFRWFFDAAGMSEQVFRSSIYMAAVCRCFPGKKTTGGDRVPEHRATYRAARRVAIGEMNYARTIVNEGLGLGGTCCHTSQRPRSPFNVATIAAPCSQMAQVAFARIR